MRFKKITTKQLKTRLRSKKLCGLSLDIDDTLSYTDYSYFEIMARYINPEKLTSASLIKKYKKFSKVPYWQTEEALPIVRKLYSSSNFHQDIPLIKEAKRAVLKINKIIPIVAYITARPISTYPGTKRWLKQHGFPDAPIVFPYLDSDHHKPRSWKAGVLQKLYPEVLGIVDDHPELKRELHRIKYKGKLFLYDNGRNMKQYHHRLQRYQNWDDIVKEIAKLKSF